MEHRGRDGRSFLAHTGDAAGRRPFLDCTSEYGQLVVMTPVMGVLLVMLCFMLFYPPVADVTRGSLAEPLAPMQGALEHCGAVLLPALLISLSAFVLWSLRHRWHGDAARARLELGSVGAIHVAALAFVWVEFGLPPADFLALAMERLPECRGAALLGLSFAAIAPLGSALRRVRMLDWLMVRRADELFCARVAPRQRPYPLHRRLRFSAARHPGTATAIYSRLFVAASLALAAGAWASGNALMLLWLALLYALCLSGQNYRRICHDEQGGASTAG